MIIISHRLNRAFDLGQILNSLTSVLREVRNCITSKSSIAVSSALCVDFLQLSLRSHNDHTGLGNDLLLVSLVDVAGQGGDQQGGQPSGRRARLRPQQTFRAIPPPSPRRQKPPFDKGGRTVEKLHPCLIACVGATMGRPSAYRRNAISGTVFIHGKRARASNARPYKSVSTRCPNLKLHFKFHSCKIRQSVLQSHSIPF